jgi:hypothetical protein
MSQKRATPETTLPERKRARLAFPTAIAAAIAGFAGLLAVGSPVGSATGADAVGGGCSAMLESAPAIVRRLEAVQTCRGAGAGCGYMQVAPEFGVLTLFCSADAPVQIFGADRLHALRVEDGALAGDCARGTWRRDAGIPGCY